MTTFTLRRATPHDTGTLATLKRRTFRETFVDGPMAIGYSPENIARFEAASYADTVIAAQLNDADRAHWVVVCSDGAMAGYAHAGPCKLPHADARAAHGELYQIYVINQYQGHGIGRILLNAALEWLGDAHPGPVWLGVFSGNLRAQAVYHARGFRKVGEYSFMVGDHRDHEFIFRRG